MATILPILPETLLLVLAILVLVIDPFQKSDLKKRPFLGWISAGGMLVIILSSLLFARPADPILVFGGMLRFDWLGFLFKMFFIFAAVNICAILYGYRAVKSDVPKHICS